MQRLHQRAREIRARAAVRAWEYRQRHHSKGVWFRLRRVLAEAREAYAISPECAEGLLAQGFTSEPVGDELEPRKTLIFVDQTTLATLPDARPVPLHLFPDLLAARHLALVRFE